MTWFIRANERCRIKRLEEQLEDLADLKLYDRITELGRKIACLTETTESLDSRITSFRGCLVTYNARQIVIFYKGEVIGMLEEEPAEVNNVEVRAYISGWFEGKGCIGGDIE